jgi:putative acetyltransferase
MQQSDVIVSRISAGSDALGALIALSDEYLSALYPPESNHLESLTALSAPNVSVYGAYIGPELVGCVASKICKGEEPYAEVKRLFVLENHRGSGISKLLMSQLEDGLREAGIPLVRLETGVEQPEAISLYRKLGYTFREPFAPYGPDPLSVFMEKRLAAP